MASLIRLFRICDDINMYFMYFFMILSIAFVVIIGGRSVDYVPSVKSVVTSCRTDS